MSLLTKAKSVPITRPRALSNSSDEEIELAIAYARHDVTAGQAAKALGEKSMSNTRNRMVAALFTAARKGYIKFPSSK